MVPDMGMDLREGLETYGITEAPPVAGDVPLFVELGGLSVAG